MKHLPLLLALVIGFTAVPVTTFAKNHDDWHESSKKLKDDVKALESHYDQVADRVKYHGNGDRRLWSGLMDIRANVDRIHDDVKRDRYDSREMRYRIDQAHNDLLRLQDQLLHGGKRHGGY
jgi:hypothetical protein